MRWQDYMVSAHLDKLMGLQRIASFVHFHVLSTWLHSQLINIQPHLLNTATCHKNILAIIIFRREVLKALMSRKVNSALVAETVYALKALSVYASVRLVWSPGHCGIKGNEMADSLSRQALHMVQLMPLPPHHLCFSKIQNGLSFWYRPTQVVLEKRPLNDCVCVCYNFSNVWSRNMAWSIFFREFRTLNSFIF